jgi:aminopeptidase N
MQIDSVCVVDGFATQPINFVREGNVFWVFSADNPLHRWAPGGNYSIIVYYSGQPRTAVNPPWDGGFSWEKDSLGNPWTSVSCQGLGASVWWPCKDAQWDEPDRGMDIHLLIQGGQQAISNGRLVDITDENQFKNYHWHVDNPINNYDVTFYIGDYAHWHDTLMGEKGKLDLDFYVLKYNEERARKHFAVVKDMLHCYEYWLGPYPFYEDGYKLVEAPYLGMEHQSAIAYGNKYQMGYLGRDRSLTMYGMDFDYIIIHESGHEWFGNSITASDMADNWIHEGITTYSESLFAECLLGKQKGKQYSRGERANIQNDKPIIGNYGVNEEGSNDMYDKGAAIMYMVRELTNDDEKFRSMLRGLSAAFYHRQVTTGQVEDYIAKHTGLNLTAFFNQYLRTDKIPQLEYYIKNGMLHYRFNNVASDFTLPVTVSDRKVTETIKPSATWGSIPWKGGYNIDFSRDFLISTKN